MKKQANHRRREVQFQVEPLVYLKLHPYRQTSMAFRSSMKLSPRFFGPFEILEKIEQVAYCLALPSGAQIHGVGHVSLLQKHLGEQPPALPSLPPVLDDSTIMPIPKKVLNRRDIQKGKYWPKTKILVKWEGLLSKMPLGRTCEGSPRLTLTSSLRTRMLWEGRNDKCVMRGKVGCMGLMKTGVLHMPCCSA